MNGSGGIQDQNWRIKNAEAFDVYRTVGTKTDLFAIFPNSREYLHAMTEAINFHYFDR